LLNSLGELSNVDVAGLVVHIHDVVVLLLEGLLIGEELDEVALVPLGLGLGLQFVAYLVRLACLPNYAV